MRHRGRDSEEIAANGRRRCAVRRISARDWWLCQHENAGDIIAGRAVWLTRLMRRVFGLDLCVRSMIVIAVGLVDLWTDFVIRFFRPCAMLMMPAASEQCVRQHEGGGCGGCENVKHPASSEQSVGQLPNPFSQFDLGQPQVPVQARPRPLLRPLRRRPTLTQSRYSHTVPSLLPHGRTLCADAGRS